MTEKNNTSASSADQVHAAPGRLSSSAENPKRRSVKNKRVARRVPESPVSRPSDQGDRFANGGGEPASAAPAPASAAPASSSSASAPAPLASPSSKDDERRKAASVGKAAKRLRVSVARRRLSPAGIALLSIVAVLAIGLGGFALIRGPLSNDASAIQGTWVGEDASRVVVITQTQIDLAGQAMYTYELDASSKHLTTTFSNLSGYAHYRFSRDGNKLAVMDVAQPDTVGSFFGDLMWTIEDAVYALQGKEHSPLTGEGVELTRRSQSQQGGSDSAPTKDSSKAQAAGDGSSGNGTDATAGSNGAATISSGEGSGKDQSAAQPGTGSAS